MRETKGVISAFYVINNNILTHQYNTVYFVFSLSHAAYYLWCSSNWQARWIRWMERNWWRQRTQKSQRSAKANVYVRYFTLVSLKEHKYKHTLSFNDDACAHTCMRWMERSWWRQKTPNIERKRARTCYLKSTNTNTLSRSTMLHAIAHTHACSSIDGWKETRIQPHSRTHKKKIFTPLI